MISNSVRRNRLFSGIKLAAVSSLLTACAANSPDVASIDIDELKAKEAMLEEQAKQLALERESLQTQQAQLNASYSELEFKQNSLDSKEQVLADREANLANELINANPPAAQMKMSMGSELLPPNAKSGECYARAWVEPTYETDTSRVLVKEASEKVKLIPAQYEWVEERVLVKEASSQLRPVAAVYGTEEETIQIKEESFSWHIDRSLNSPPASAELLKTAQGYGIDLASAKPGMCFHEHFTPAKYETVSEQVLEREASSKISAIPAKFDWVDQRVMVSEASWRLEEVPAVYETVTEQVVDVPAHTIWKKGTGPIQRIDEATGEIMCLVEVPATYKTISKRVLKSPATTRRVEIPAQFENVRVKRLVTEAQQQTQEIPAQYRTVQRVQKIADESFAWHEISDNTMSKESRTGAQICLLKDPAQFKTVQRRVVISPATVETVQVPAVYETVKVKKLVSEAREERIQIPAEFRTVSSQRLVQDGRMEWRSILCETNITPSKITQIQQALLNEGYNPGPIDGVIGQNTVQAINAFQRARNLPVDKYLNIATVEALGVVPQ